MSAYLHSFPFTPRDPFDLWQEFNRRNRHGFILFSNRFLYLSLESPSSIFTTYHQDRTDTLTKIAGMAERNARAYPFPRFVGFLGFDAGRRFDRGLSKRPRRPDPLRWPEMWFCETRALLRIDFQKEESVLFLTGRNSVRRLGRILRRLSRSENFSGPAPRAGIPTRLPDKKAVFVGPDFKTFREMVVSAKKKIAEGDVYQANLSLRFKGRLRKNPVAFFKELARVNPSPYACLIRTGRRWIASCSPELLVSVEGRKTVTRPIAGTRPRGRSRNADRKRRGQLLLSSKERAEHIMLVDLERNDLGRVCRPGSVRVTDRAVVETYSHVMHIVSQVEGVLSNGRTSADALRVLFPGGTISGCPKIRSVEIIEELENQSRGPFYGSAGFFCWNGDASFNILIRTALIDGKKLWVQAGAGIVADSRPRREYKEILAKARALFLAADGFVQSAGRRTGRSFVPQEKKAGGG